MKSALITILVACIPTLAAATEVPQPLLNSKALACNFQKGTVGRWDFIESDMDVRFSDSGFYTAPIIFKSIDFKKRTALQVGTRGSYDDGEIKATMLSTPAKGGELTFIAELDSGTLVTITSIFAHINPQRQSQPFAAVHSRHQLGMSSQYFGVCRSIDH